MCCKDIIIVYLEASSQPLLPSVISSECNEPRLESLRTRLLRRNKVKKILWSRPVGVLELLGVKTIASFPPLPFCLGTDATALKQIAFFSISIFCAAACPHPHLQTLMRTSAQQTHSLSPEGNWSQTIWMQDQPRNDCLAISDRAWIDFF